MSKKTKKIKIGKEKSDEFTEFVINKLVPMIMETSVKSFNAGIQSDEKTLITIQINSVEMTEEQTTSYLDTLEKSKDEIDYVH